MAGDLEGFALEKAELFSSRLKELLSAGQGYVRAQFGVDLGLKPELYPTWVILSTAAVGLLLLLCLSWVAVCGGLLVGKKRGSPLTQSSGEPNKANLVKTTKPEEQKKRNKKKTLEKKTQSNGQPVTVAQEEVKVTPVVSKPSSDIKTEKVHGVQAPVQVKKNKKKTKTDVKPVQHVTTNDTKEPDDGAWETKVSNREKRQQRRKDKGPEDSGSSGGVETPKTHVIAPVATAPTNTKKNRGSHESLPSRTTGKGDVASGAVSSSWREEPSVNGVGWTDISRKLSGQRGAMEGTKWSNVSTAPHYRVAAEPQRWTQETQAAWSGIDGRIKTELNPVSFSMRRLNTTEPISNSVELQWASHRDADNEWSGFNGMAAADPSSDWNAPAEHWGNYEEPPVSLTPAPPLKQQPSPNKVSEDEKDTEDPSGGAAKSKKKRKKKKKTEEEAASEPQVVSAAPLVNAGPKPQELPVMASKKLNPSISSSQKKSEQTAEPPKPSQKKKVRRET
ncbi:protein LYRIC-like isoform X1 [Seriola lalandi dorsalis]|uniref:protein LYRIC-like isoform X1 n=1 Tax=Seriola lalandi dorsalis TaxID=1841481 RepID=UPI000C6F708E|nr:protein LYRIC-like isoform X1 [Seriola lalandi dorsalis]